MATKLGCKIIRTGASGLCVTLPKGWTEFCDLKPGDKVTVVVNGSLVITPKVMR